MKLSSIASDIDTFESAKDKVSGKIHAPYAEVSYKDGLGTKFSWSWSRTLEKCTLFSHNNHESGAHGKQEKGRGCQGGGETPFA